MSHMLTRDEALDLLKHYMAKYLDMTKWSARIVRGGPRRLGCCRWRGDGGIIELTGWYVDRNDLVSITDTILHEIAHALAGRDAGHGPLWKAACIRIGAKPERLAAHGTFNRPAFPFIAQCSVCNATFNRMTRPKYSSRHWCNCQRDVPPETRAYLHFRGNAAAVVNSHDKAPDEVRHLLSQLAIASRADAKKIRARLRKLGHTGGING